MILWLFLALSAYAQTEVKYLRNYDGDTITFNYGKVRVLGIDTGELKSKRPCEAQYGVIARVFVEKELKNARRISLTNLGKRDKFGRILANVEYDGKNLKEVMLSNHLAVPYVPKYRQKVDWCALREKRK
jgi:endonuclease YncB( thermonuclease family)